MSLGQEARKAEVELFPLAAATVRDGLTPEREHLEVVKAIGRGEPVRNARLALDAVKLMLEFTQAKPAQQHDIRQAVIQIISPYGEEPIGLPGTAVPQAPALPPGPPPTVSADRPRNAAELKRQEFERAAALRDAQAKPLPPEPPKPAPHFLEVATPERERARVLASARAPEVPLE